VAAHPAQTGRSVHAAPQLAAEPAELAPRGAAINQSRGRHPIDPRSGRPTIASASAADRMRLPIVPVLVDATAPVRYGLTDVDRAAPSNRAASAKLTLVENQRHA
jgi:hypothetical protein